MSIKWDPVSESKSLSHSDSLQQSVEFSRAEYWNRQPFPSPGHLPNPGIQPRSPALQADSLPTELSGKTQRPNLMVEVCGPFVRMIPGMLLGDVLESWALIFVPLAL